VKSLKIISQSGTDIFTTALSLMMKEHLSEEVQVLSFFDDLSIPDLSNALVVCIWTKGTHDLIMSVIKKLRNCEPSFQFVIIDMEHITQQEIREYVKQGKVAVISSKASTKDLLLCIEKLDHEQVALCPHIQDRVIHSLLEKQDNRDIRGCRQFNKTEQAIIETAKKGYSMKEAAEELHLSKNTIAAYRSKIMKKADVKTMTQLISILSEREAGV